MNKQYKKNYIIFVIIILVSSAFIIFTNLNEATIESLIKGVAIIGVGFTIILLEIMYCSIEIHDGKLKQKDWFFFKKQVDIQNLASVEYDPKYEFFFMHNGYIVLKEQNSEEVAMAINPRSYKPSVISEFLSDLKNLNDSVQFDDQVKEIQGGKVLG